MIMTRVTLSQLPWRGFNRTTAIAPSSCLRLQKFACRQESTLAEPPSKADNAFISSTEPPLSAESSTTPTEPFFISDEPFEPKKKPEKLRLPRSVQAVYLKPLRREAEYGVPSCDLQMRSYSVRNLEFFADFALRAAYYCGLPAYGPVPLPRITERWTVPVGHFIYKKTQENFERKTLRRLIQIKDGHPETVQLWLAFLRKHSYYGIGMKANVWEYNKLGVGKSMNADIENMRGDLEDVLARFGKGEQSKEGIMEFINRENLRSSRR